MVKPIKNNREYIRALKKIYELMQKDSKPGSAKSNELELLSILVEYYEEKHFPIYPPDPVEAIKLKMEQLGISRFELSKYLGYKSRVSEVLGRKRHLTLPMIRTIHKKLKIPAESLIG